MADVTVLQKVGCVFVDPHTDALELWAEVSDRKIKQHLGVSLVSVKNVNFLEVGLNECSPRQQRASLLAS